MDGPVEDDVVLLGALYQLLQLLGFLFGIGLAPVGRAVVGVVLGTVNVDVHLVASVEVQLAEACLVAPGLAVETFHHAAVGNVGIVRDLHHRELAQGEELCQGLHAVVGTAFVVGGDDDVVLVYLQVIAFGLLGNVAVEFLDTLVAPDADADLELGPLGLAWKQVVQQGQGWRGGLQRSLQTVLRWDADAVFLRFIHLGKGAQAEVLCLERAQCQQAQHAGK